MICDRCGAELQIGSYPFCRGRVTDHGHGDGTVIGDEMDHVQVNGTATPIRFRSKAERRRWLKAHHLTESASHQPLPGTDKSPHTVNWGSRMDPVTAANVKDLLERAFRQTPDPVDPPLHVTTTIKELTKAEARAYAGR